MDDAPARRVRLVEAVVQLSIVLDDGTTLVKQDIQPVVIPATDWDEFRKGGGYERSLAQLEQQVNEAPAAPED